VNVMAETNPSEYRGYGGECNGCGRDIQHVMPRLQERNSRSDIWVKCDECGKATRLSIANENIFADVIDNDRS